MSISRRISASMVIATMVLLLASCGFNNQYKEVIIGSDNFIIENYMNNFNKDTHVEYEQIVIKHKPLNFLEPAGQSDPEYKGIIYITNDKLNELNNNYEWRKVDKIDIYFDKLNIDNIYNDEWFYSKDFINDTFNEKVYCIETYFNKQDKIIFDIQVF